MFSAFLLDQHLNFRYEALFLKFRPDLSFDINDGDDDPSPEIYHNGRPRCPSTWVSSE